MIHDSQPPLLGPAWWEPNLPPRAMQMDCMMYTRERRALELKQWRRQRASERGPDNTHSSMARACELMKHCRCCLGQLKPT